MEAAAGAVETGDLDRPGLKIYDGFGRRLKATDTSGRRRESVMLHPPETDEVSHALRVRLQQYVAKCAAPDQDLSTTSIQTLVLMLLAHEEAWKASSKFKRTRVLVRVATILGFAIVAELNLIIGLGLTGASPKALHVAVEILPWLVVAFSLSATDLFWRRGRRFLAICLLANVALVLAAGFVRHEMGMPLNQTMLWIADLWFLNLHVMALDQLLKL